MNTATPKIYIVGETSVDHEQMQLAIDEMTGTQDGNWDPLFNGANSAALMTEFAGKGCYLSFEDGANKNLTRTGTRSTEEYIGEQILKQKHGSVLEHSTVNVQITNASRVLTHELVRHRVGTAYSQLSGRYVRESIRLWVPSCIAENPEAVKVFERSLAQDIENQAELERIFQIDQASFTRKKILTSAFRRLNPLGAASHILVSANHRTWRHIIELRTHESAEEEIRLVFGLIARALAERFSEIYQDMNDVEINGHFKYWFTNTKV